MKVIDGVDGSWRVPVYMNTVCTLQQWLLAGCRSHLIGQPPMLKLTRVRLNLRW